MLEIGSTFDCLDGVAAISSNLPAKTSYIVRALPPARQFVILKIIVDRLLG